MDEEGVTVPIPSTGIEEPSANVTGGSDDDFSREEKRDDIPVR